MKVVNLHKREVASGKEMYSFSLVLEGFIVNGFMYSRESGAILAPRLGNKSRVVRGFGQSFKRLRPLLEDGIKNLKGANDAPAL